MANFDLSPIFSEEDFTHWFLPRENIVDCYVIETANESGSGSKITDFFSFYSLPSTIMSHPQHNLLRAAYAFYSVAKTVSWPELIGDALVVAKKVRKYQ